MQTDLFVRDRTPRSATTTLDRRPPVRVRVTRRIPDADLDDTRLAARLKHEAGGRPVDYGTFVIRRNLQPGIDAKQFYNLYRDADPSPYEYRWDEAFRPTHQCRTTGLLVQVNPRTCGTIADLLIESGSWGSEPTPGGSLPERFIAL